MQQVKQATFKQYVLAGSGLMQRDSIVVSAHVSLENPGDEDGRERFVAGVAKKQPATINLKTMAVLVLICLIAGLVMNSSKAALTHRLQAEYAQLSARYVAAQTEVGRLQEVFLQKSDASGICYDAVQRLGMRLAGHEETIGLQAAGVPAHLLGNTIRGSASNGY